MYTRKKYAINIHIHVSLTVQLTGNPEAGLVIGQPFIRTLDPVIGQPFIRTLDPKSLFSRWTIFET